MADGGSVSCSGVVQNLHWWTQGHSFTQDMRVLALGSFDIILGADWLEDHSPMWVHWQHKKMRFMHNGKRIVLHGFKSASIDCRSVACHKLKGLLRRKAITHMIQLQRIPLPAQGSDTIATIAASTNSDAVPSDIQNVLDKFSHVFQDTSVSAFGPPKWVLMIMTCTIKELMHLLSYEQDLKSLKMKREVSTLNSLEERCMCSIDEFY